LYPLYENEVGFLLANVEKKMSEEKREELTQVVVGSIILGMMIILGIANIAFSSL